MPYHERHANRDLIFIFAKQAKGNQVTALDITKRLRDYNQHAPTIYFPLLLPECFLTEPTETETKETMHNFVDAMERMLNEANTDPDTVPRRRLTSLRDGSTM